MFIPELANRKGCFSLLWIFFLSTNYSDGQKLWFSSLRGFIFFHESDQPTYHNI